MKLHCKISYEVDFDADEYIADCIEKGFTEEEAKAMYAKNIENDVFSTIDWCADNNIYVPYVRVFKKEWREE